MKTSHCRSTRLRPAWLAVAMALGLSAPDPWGQEPRPSAGFPREWLVFADRVSPRSEPSRAAKPRGSAVVRGDTLAIERVERDARGNTWLGWKDKDRELWIPEALANRLWPQQTPTGNLPIGDEIVNRERALPLDYKPDDLVPLPKEFRYEPEIPYLLRAEAGEKAVAMLEAARAEGLRLRVVSAYRPADLQRELYLKKIEESGLGQRTVTKPGHSEHQLGTTIDVAGPDEASLLKRAFGETKEGRWIRDNAARFGFVISYREDNETQSGYDPEPWHLRYVGVDRAGQARPARNETPSPAS